MPRDGDGGSSVAMGGLAVGGLTPLSTLDFPDALAAVVFCLGCPWNCRYCHNPGLRDGADQDGLDWASVLAWLHSRIGLLDAVVFSGGEPTLQPGLPAAMAAVKAMGFKVGLHTAGLAPGALASALPSCDWVGLDIKAPRGVYRRATGTDGGQAPFACLEMLKEAAVQFEVRTTWHPDILGEADMIRLAGELSEAEAGNWIIQPFRPDGCSDQDMASRGPAVFQASALHRLREAGAGLTIAVRD